MLRIAGPKEVMVLNTDVYKKNDLLEKPNSDELDNRGTGEGRYSNTCLV